MCSPPPPPPRLPRLGEGWKGSSSSSCGNGVSSSALGQNTHTHTRTNGRQWPQHETRNGREREREREKWNEQRHSLPCSARSIDRQSNCAAYSSSTTSSANHRYVCSACLDRPCTNIHCYCWPLIGLARLLITHCYWWLPPLSLVFIPATPSRAQAKATHHSNCFWILIFLAFSILMTLWRCTFHWFQWHHLLTFCPEMLRNTLSVQIVSGLEFKKLEH